MNYTFVQRLRTIAHFVLIALLYSCIKFAILYTKHQLTALVMRRSSQFRSSFVAAHL